MRVFARALTALLAGALAFAGASAQAATVTADKPCYTPRETAVLTGVGFTPGARVDLLQEARLLPAAQPILVQDDGVFTTGLRAPALKAGERVDHLTAIEVGGTEVKAGFNLRMSARAVGVTPLIGPPGLRRTIRVRGFTAARELYAHITRGGTGDTRTTRVGNLRAPCGKLVLRKRFFGKRARAGRYRVQFDALPDYAPTTRPRVVRTVTIVRQPRRTRRPVPGLETWIGR